MRYWAYLDGRVEDGSSPEELASLPGFGEETLVCPAEGPTEAHNWRRAAQFPDLVEALAKKPPPEPPAPLGAPDPADAVRSTLPPGFIPKGPEEVLGDSGARIFSHVNAIMGELEARRRDHSLVQELRREAAGLREELAEARRRIAELEGSHAVLKAMEDREKTYQRSLERARAESAARAAELAAMEERIAPLRAAAEGAAREAAEKDEELRRRGGLVDELTRRLAEKEVSLSRALGLLGALDRDLGALAAKPTGNAEPRGGPRAEVVAEAPPAPEEPVPVKRSPLSKLIDAIRLPPAP